MANTCIKRSTFCFFLFTFKHCNSCCCPLLVVFFCQCCMVWQDLGASISLARRLQSCSSLIRNDHKFDWSLARFIVIRMVLRWLFCQGTSVCMPGRKQCSFGRYRVTWFVSSVVRRVYADLNACGRLHLHRSPPWVLSMTCPLICKFTFLPYHWLCTISCLIDLSQLLTFDRIVCLVTFSWPC